MEHSTALLCLWRAVRTRTPCSLFRQREAFWRPILCVLSHLLSTPISSFRSPERLKTSPHIIRATFTFKCNITVEEIHWMLAKWSEAARRAITIVSSQIQNQKKEFSVTCTSSLSSPLPPKVNHSHVHSCTVALTRWVIKGDDDYVPYYASLEGFQFNTEGPNGATVYLK